MVDVSKRRQTQRALDTARTILANGHRQWRGQSHDEHGNGSRLYFAIFPRPPGLEGTDEFHAGSFANDANRSIRCTGALLSAADGAVMTKVFVPAKDGPYSRTKCPLEMLVECTAVAVAGWTIGVAPAKSGPLID